MSINWDVSFIQQLKNKEEKAYVQLFDSLFADLHKLAHSYVRDSDVANDIVQDVFISIYENCKEIDAILNMEGYMRTSVRNRCYNYLRDLALEDRNRELYFREIAETGCWDDSERKALSEEVYKIIDALPESCRNICYLRFYKGEKIKDIAEELQLSESTVKVQLHRAMNRLKETLRDENSVYLNLKKLSVIVFFSSIV